MRSLLLDRRQLLSVLCLGLFLTALGSILFGVRCYVVTSGSMEPAIPVGSGVFVRKCAFGNICAGDVITYKIRNSATVVTHRVVMVDHESGWVRTRGDANRLEDFQPVFREQILGKVVLIWKGCGPLLLFLNHTRGKMCICALVLAVGISLFGKGE